MSTPPINPDQPHFISKLPETNWKQKEDGQYYLYFAMPFSRATIENFTGDPELALNEIAQACREAVATDFRRNRHLWFSVE